MLTVVFVSNSRLRARQLTELARGEQSGNADTAFPAIITSISSLSRFGLFTILTLEWMWLSCNAPVAAHTNAHTHTQKMGLKD